MHALRLIGLEWAKGMGKSVNRGSVAVDGFGQYRSWMVTFVLDCLRSGWYAYTVRKEWRRACERSFLFPLFTLFYYLLLFFTKFTCVYGMGLIGLYLSKGVGRSVRTRSFFNRIVLYSNVQLRTGTGVTGCKGRKRKKGETGRMWEGSLLFLFREGGAEKGKTLKH